MRKLIKIVIKDTMKVFNNSYYFQHDRTPTENTKITTQDAQTDNIATLPPPFFFQTHIKTKKANKNNIFILQTNWSAWWGLVYPPCSPLDPK